MSETLALSRIPLDDYAELLPERSRSCARWPNLCAAAASR
jgi:hypothetical protein